MLPPSTRAGKRVARVGLRAKEAPDKASKAALGKEIAAMNKAGEIRKVPTRTPKLAFLCDTSVQVPPPAFQFCSERPGAERFEDRKGSEAVVTALR